MTAHCRRPSPRPQPLYFAECHYGKLGVEFEALDRDKNSRAEIVRMIRVAREHGRREPERVLEVIEPCEDFPRGQCLDVTEELRAESREPPMPASAEALRQILIDHDRDVRKHSVFGW